MVVSNALPLQFWDVDDVTFNEATDENVDLQCYFKEYHQDEEIRHQVYDTADRAYELLIEDEDGEEIMRLPYVFTASPTPRHDIAFTPSLLDPPLENRKVKFKIVQLLNIVLSPNFEDSSHWANSGSGGNWTIVDETAEINFTGSGQSSKDFENDVLPDSHEGDFIVRIVLNQNDSADVVNFRLGLGSDDQFYATGGLGDYTFEERVEDIPSFNQIDFSASSPGTGTKKITVYSVHVFSSGEGEIVKKGDLVQLTDTPQDNIIIRYKSSKNTAKIVYSEDDPYYTIRVKGRFWYARPKTEQQSEPLSDSQNITTATASSIQRLLTIDDTADYMIEKIVKILQHCAPGTVLIPEKQGGVPIAWVIGDNIQDNLPNTDGYCFIGLEVYLTKKSEYTRTLI